MADVLTPQQQRSLADRVRLGEASAEDELVRSFERRVFVMLAVRTRDREAARDLTQEVLLAVLGALRKGQLREGEKLAAFVHGTARNLMNGFFRQRSQEPRQVELTPEMSLADPLDEFERAEESALVRRALSGLDLLDQRILLMTLIEGMKPGEIAPRLGISSENVRARKSRALKKVIERLASVTKAAGAATS